MNAGAGGGAVNGGELVLTRLCTISHGLIALGKSAWHTGIVPRFSLG
jgi:hypothetical protein